MDSHCKKLRSTIVANQEFAGAKRCMLKTLYSQNGDYAWIEEFVFD